MPPIIASIGIGTLFNLILFLSLLAMMPTLVDGCTQQYRRELNYLDFYLGIRPANELGEIGVNGKH
jgi:uncharacterized membrane protein